jgi:magnesium-transporting ATPase (P-type)
MIHPSIHQTTHSKNRDLLRIHKNSRIPADCILLRVSSTEGDGISPSCFIRTDQLDGETDWKMRVPLPTSQKLSSDEALLHSRGVLYGTFTFSEKKRGPWAQRGNCVSWARWRNFLSKALSAFLIWRRALLSYLLYFYTSEAKEFLFLSKAQSALF